MFLIFKKISQKGYYFYEKSLLVLTTAVIGIGTLVPNVFASSKAYADSYNEPKTEESVTLPISLSQLDELETLLTEDEFDFSEASSLAMSPVGSLIETRAVAGPPGYGGGKVYTWGKAELEKIMGKNLSSFPTSSSILNWLIATGVAKFATKWAPLYGFTVAVTQDALKKQQTFLSDCLNQIRLGKAIGVKVEVGPNPSGSYPIAIVKLTLVR